MIKTICILGILLCFSGLVSAQERADTIRIEKRQVSRFYYQDFRLKHAQMVLLTKPNPEAYKEMLKAKHKYGTANFLGFTGGFLIGYQISSTLLSKDASWEVSAIGLCLILSTIPFSSSYSYHATNAARIYNGGLKDTSIEYEKIELGITGSGVGFKLTF